MVSKKKVFITGASRGIGQAIKTFYEKEGFEVLSPSRQELNLSDPNKIQDYLDQVKPQADILINNAGINIISPIEEMSHEQWQEIMQVNLNSAFLLVKYFARQMQENSWGRITNISSCFSHVSKKQRSAYTASKAALNAFTKTAAIEYAEHNVLVNSVCPGFIETDMTSQNNSPEQIKEICKSIPMARLAQTEEMLGLIEYLNSEKNTYLTGQAITIDGGYTLI